MMCAIRHFDLWAALLSDPFTQHILRLILLWNLAGSNRTTVPGMFGNKHCWIRAEQYHTFVNTFVPTLYI